MHVQELVQVTTTSVDGSVNKSKSIPYSIHTDNGANGSVNTCTAGVSQEISR